MVMAVEVMDWGGEGYMLGYEGMSSVSGYFEVSQEERAIGELVGRGRLVGRRRELSSIELQLQWPH